jgi:hypothetical protein
MSNFAMMDLCNTCVLKIVCDLCGKQLCHPGPNGDKCLKNPHQIEEHCHIYGEILCVKCYEKQVLLRESL